jgi:5'-phosphate synthase pdxT subunit
MKIGVLALQGDFREHISASERSGHSAVGIRRPSELEDIDALIFPGGESTTIALLAKNFDLFQPRRAIIQPPTIKRAAVENPWLNI